MVDKQRKNMINNESFNEIQEFFQSLFVNQVDGDLRKVVESLNGYEEKLKKSEDQNSEYQCLLDESNRQIETLGQNISANTTNLGVVINTLTNMNKKINEHTGAVDKVAQEYKAQLCKISEMVELMVCLKDSCDYISKRLDYSVDISLIKERMEEFNEIQKEFKMIQEQIVVTCKNVNGVVETIPNTIKEKIDLQAEAYNEVLFSIRDSIKEGVGENINKLVDDNRQRMIKLWVAIGILLASNLYFIIKGFIG